MGNRDETDTACAIFIIMVVVTILISAVCIDYNSGLFSRLGILGYNKILYS